MKFLPAAPRKGEADCAGRSTGRAAGIASWSKRGCGLPEIGLVAVGPRVGLTAGEHMRVRAVPIMPQTRVGMSSSGPTGRAVHPPLGCDKRDRSE